MQYMMLIYSSEAASPKPGSDEFGALIQNYQGFTEEVRNNKALVSGDALQPVTTATTVSVRNGKTETMDGPFAETKEQLGGYYLLECKDLDEAIEYAAKIPTAEYGRIEIRPVVVWD